MSTVKTPKAKATTTGINLFASATKKVAKSAAKDDKVVVIFKGEVSDAIKKYEDAKKAKAEAEAAMAQAESIIKPEAQAKFLEEYNKTGKRTESFILSGTGHDNSLLYITMDAYKKIDEERYNYLADTYGDDVVEDNSEYIMDKEMIQKYGAQISEAIMKAKNIPQDVKLKIIKKVENFSVAKGTINKMVEIAKKAKTTISALFEEIMPTQQLKSRGK
jgi:hypothetical protein